MAKSGKSPAAGRGTGKHRAAAEDSADEMGSEDATESHEEEEAPRASKRGTGKFKAASGRTSGSFKKTTGRVKAVSPPKTSGHELIPVVCSECYEELVYDSGSKAEEIVCPVCEHSAGKPDQATLHHISDKRRTEKKNFVLAFVVWLFGVAGLGGWSVLAQNPVNAADDGMFWGPFGVGMLSFLVVMILAWKYENNRWEVYF